MARIRSIKPDFFLDEDLAELSFQDRIAFIGLWCQADREGRLEDRHKYLKALIFPYDDIKMNEVIERLSNGDKPFINRYVVDNRGYIQINNFLKHQRPHHTEKESTFPPLEDGELTVIPLIKKVGKGKEKGKEGEGEGKGKDVSLPKLRESLDEFKTTFSDIDVEGEFVKFEDYLKSKGKQYKDYFAAFRNRLRQPWVLKKESNKKLYRYYCVDHPEDKTKPLPWGKTMSCPICGQTMTYNPNVGVE